MAILCLDFDGVIHNYSSGWKGASVIPDPPVEGSIEAILHYLDAGFEVSIFSSRSKSIFGRWAMQRYIGNAIADYWERGGNALALRDAECRSDAFAVAGKLKWPWFKPAAFITIDDRALTFTGQWPTAAELRGFRPWNKR